MNEEDSTFFVTIEKNNMKNQFVNFKNMKLKQFCHPIKIKTKKSNKKNHNYSASFPSNSMPNIKTIPSKINKINNISKINIMQNYIQKDDKSQTFILLNKNNNNDNNNDTSQKISNNLEENIDFEDDDIDENNNMKFNININKPKLPFNNNNYYNDDNNKLNSNISRNTLNNYLNKNKTTINSKIKMNNKCKLFKNKSCSFINNDILKLRLNQSISITNTKIEMLKNLIKRRNAEFLYLQILFEKINSQQKMKKTIKNYEKKIDEMHKEIFNLKLKVSKYQEKYIKKKILEKELNKEKLIYSTKKTEIIEKILEYKVLIMNKNQKNDFNSNNKYIEESTINNDSFIFENEYNILDTKENINFSPNNNLRNKTFFNEKVDEELKNINENEINSIKNKNVANYFVPRFFIERKNINKNNFKLNLNQPSSKSKFNIFINSNKKK